MSWVQGCPARITGSTAFCSGSLTTNARLRNTHRSWNGPRSARKLPACTSAYATGNRAVWTGQIMTRLSAQVQVSDIQAARRRARPRACRSYCAAPLGSDHPTAPEATPSVPKTTPAAGLPNGTPARRNRAGCRPRPRDHPQRVRPQFGDRRNNRGGPILYERCIRTRQNA